MQPNTYSLPGLTFLLYLLCSPFLAAQQVEPISYERAFAALTFEFPAEIQNADDGSNRLYVVEQLGRIRSFVAEEDATSSTVFLDLTGTGQIEFSRGQELGLLGLAFHPNYSENRFFYVYHTRRRGSGPRQMVLSRFRATADFSRADPNSRLEIFSFEKNQSSSNHNGGKVAFGPDGYLYISIGDGGGANDPNRNAQNTDIAFGSVLRLDIDVDGSNPVESNPDLPSGNYEIPVDNPFVGTRGLDEIYAWGIRNTWKFSFDEVSGRLWGGDVGQGRYEEVNLIENGGNYGWSRFEGDDFLNGNPDDRAPLTPGSTDTKPVEGYDHSNGDRSITLGYVYRGAITDPRLQGKLVFGDFATGRVWSMGYDASSGRATKEFLFRTDGQAISTFGLDEAGTLYFSDYKPGGDNIRVGLYRIVAGESPTNKPTVVDGTGTWEAIGGSEAVTAASATQAGTLYLTRNAANGASGSVVTYTEADGFDAIPGAANGPINALAVTADGAIYAGGDFTEIGGVAASNVAVWDGTTWSGLTSGTDQTVAALTVGIAGDLYVGGGFSTAGGVTVSNVAKWDGGAWSALTDATTGEVGTNNEIRSIAFDGTGTMYLGGNFDAAGGKPASRIATFDGRNWGTLGEGTTGFVEAIAITNNLVYAGGSFTGAGNGPANRLAAWNLRTGEWEPVASGLTGPVSALAFDGTYLYVGGSFLAATTADGEDYLVNQVARWSAATDWEALGAGTTVGTNRPVATLQLAGNGSDLYVGGSFTRAGTLAAPGIAKWVATPADDDAIVNGAVYELQPQHSLRLRLDVRNVSTRNSALVDGFPSNGGANQRWKFISLGNDVWEIEPQHAPGKRLDVAGASTATNTEIHIYDRHGRNNQQWRALPVGDGSYRFEPLNAPGKRLDIESINGTQRALSRTLDRGNSQRWRLLPVSRAAAISAARSEWIEPDATFTVYPNPASTQLTVESAAEYHFALFDATGREVLTGNYAAGIQRLDVSQLPTGLYIAKLTATDKETMSTRVIIE